MKYLEFVVHEKLLYFSYASYKVLIYDSFVDKVPVKESCKLPLLYLFLSMPLRSKLAFWSSIEPLRPNFISVDYAYGVFPWVMVIPSTDGNFDVNIPSLFGSGSALNF